MQQIIQCVPNFSEGRDPSTIEAIVKAAAEAGDARVVDHSSDADHNRMVVTLLGDPQGIRAALFAAAREAVGRIDMRTHNGVHPRIGAVDVVPVVPVARISMEECVDLSHKIGRDLAEKLDIPVYLYEKSAATSGRTKLADIRRGGFEKLLAEGLSGDKAPDFGPMMAHPTAGATVVGARGPLVAFNVILKSEDLPLAKSIAKKLRSGEAGLSGVKSIGVRLSSRSEVQVSMNITMPDKVSLNDAFRFVEKEAKDSGVEVSESEVIGVVAKKFVGDITKEEMLAHNFLATQILDRWI